MVDSSVKNNWLYRDSDICVEKKTRPDLDITFISSRFDYNDNMDIQQIYDQWDGNLLILS